MPTFNNTKLSKGKVYGINILFFLLYLWNVWKGRESMPLLLVVTLYQPSGVQIIL